MRKNLTTIIIAFWLGLMAITSHAQPPAGVELVDLLTAKLEGTTDTEVVVSRVTIPPNTSLPKHWHPGEEFAYILKGSVILWQKGKKDLVGKEGEVLIVPLKQIHTAKTQNEGVELLVFRVHELGKPQRYPAK